MVHPRGHQKVARALRRGFDQHGGLQLDKPVLVKIVAGDLRDAVAHQDVVLQIRPPQIQIAVFQPDRLGGGGMFHDLKRRGFRFVQNPQLLHRDLHIAGGDGIVFRRADPHPAARRQHILTAHRKRFVKHRAIGGFVKCQLHNAAAVAQVHKNQLTQVALALYPAANRHFRALVGGAQIAAIMRAFQSLQCFRHDDLSYS